jgi:hypothetical protein
MDRHGIPCRFSNHARLIDFLEQNRHLPPSVIWDFLPNSTGLAEPCHSAAISMASRLGMTGTPRPFACSYAWQIQDNLDAKVILMVFR